MKKYTKASMPPIFTEVVVSDIASWSGVDDFFCELTVMNLKTQLQESNKFTKQVKRIKLVGTETIGAFAFAKCSKLERVSIPLSVTSIDKDAFKFKSSLTIDVEYETGKFAQVPCDVFNILLQGDCLNIQEIRQAIKQNACHDKSILHGKAQQLKIACEREKMDFMKAIFKASVGATLSGYGQIKCYDLVNIAQIQASPSKNCDVHRASTFHSLSSRFFNTKLCSVQKNPTHPRELTEHALAFKDPNLRSVSSIVTFVGQGADSLGGVIVAEIEKALEKTKKVLQKDCEKPTSTREYTNLISARLPVFAGILSKIKPLSAKYEYNEVALKAIAAASAYVVLAASFVGSQSEEIKVAEIALLNCCNWLSSLDENQNNNLSQEICKAIAEVSTSILKDRDLTDDQIAKKLAKIGIIKEKTAEKPLERNSVCLQTGLCQTFDMAGYAEEKKYDLLCKVSQSPLGVWECTFTVLDEEGTEYIATSNYYDACDKRRQLLGKSPIDRAPLSGKAMTVEKINGTKVSGKKIKVDVAPDGTVTPKLSRSGTLEYVDTVDDLTC